MSPHFYTYLCFSASASKCSSNPDGSSGLRPLHGASPEHLHLRFHKPIGLTWSLLNSPSFCVSDFLHYPATLESSVPLTSTHSSALLAINLSNLSLLFITTSISFVEQSHVTSPSTIERTLWPGSLPLAPSLFSPFLIQKHKYDEVTSPALSQSLPGSSLLQCKVQNSHLDMKDPS